MYAATPEKTPFTVRTLAARKAAGEKIVALTAYDATFSAVMDECGVDVILVGDSLGNVMQGHTTTLQVKVDDVVYHCACVTRGTQRPLVIADLPFGSYPDPRKAFDNAARLVVEGGAVVVKLEGAGHVLESIRYLTDRDVPVCAHLGLTPQSVNALGGYRVQGREEAAARRLRDDALAVQQAGAVALVLEMVPAALAKEITASLAIPTIGIGAGVDCDGQILVSYDLLGITRGKRPRFAQSFLPGLPSIQDAIRTYVAAVRSREFPTAAQSY